MNDDARRLRAQIPASTDPEWLERMAHDAERATAQQPVPTQQRAIAPEPSDPISDLSDPVNTMAGARR